MSSALFIAWRTGDESQGSWSPVGKLQFVDGVYRFAYTRGARSLQGFEPFPGMPRLDLVYESDTLFPIFANRLLTKSRPEYEAYLTWAGFDPDNPPDPLAILGVTEGRRQTDSLEVFPSPVPDGDGCYLTKFFVHGIRWFPSAAIDRISRLAVGECLALMPDPMNAFDQHAVALRTADVSERYLIGYVPRYLAYDVLNVLFRCDPSLVNVTVERINSEAPLQMRLLCRMNACWPEYFRPCSGEEFQPIALDSGGKKKSLTDGKAA